MKINRLSSLQITDSVYRLTMLSTVLSYADKSEAVDSETDGDRQITLLLLMMKYCPPPPKTLKGAKYFFKV